MDDAAYKSKKQKEDLEKKRREEDEKDLALRKSLKKDQFLNIFDIRAGLEEDDAAGEKLAEMVVRTGPIIDQVNSLYQQYSRGVEKSPPNERRKQLEGMITTIQLMAKPTPALRFRSNAVIAKFNTYKDRWDRLMKDLESGKIERPHRTGKNLK